MANLSGGYDSRSDYPDGPAKGIALVTKGASVLPNGICRALLVGTAGTANVTDAYGNDVDNVPLPVGYNFLAVSKVRAGGTADAIYALY